MDKFTQTQKGGDNSNQIQAGTVVVNNNIGITEERAREIFSSEITRKMDVLAVEARDIATARMLDLFSDLISRVKKCEKDLSSFSDPAFLQNVRIAQDAAAVSERKEDIETLAELLVARMSGKLKRATKTGIRKAMEIVPELEADELTALTALLFYNRFNLNNKFGTGVESYLAGLDESFRKMLRFNLPEGHKWLIHLVVLDAVAVDATSRFVPVGEYYSKDIDGMICAGIDVNSKEYAASVQLLNACGLSQNLLVPNELISGFVRLPFVRLHDFSIPITIQDGQDIQRMGTINVTGNQRQGLEKVIKLYRKDTELLKRVKAEFAKRFSQYDALKKFKDWLEDIRHGFELTSVGEALGYVNARRCIPDLPAIELE